MEVTANESLGLWHFESGHEEGGEPSLEVGEEDAEVGGLGGGGGRAASGAGEPHLPGDQCLEVACMGERKDSGMSDRWDGEKGRN